MIRVVLVDDQAVVRAGFRVLLEEHGDIAVVGEAAGGREAVAVVARERPDVVCMDLRMPAGDGLMATRRIVASRKDGVPAVLVVTTFDLDADVFGALEAGPTDSSSRTANRRNWSTPSVASPLGTGWWTTPSPAG